MHWRFDSLFSIKVLLSKDSSQTTVDFSFEPTKSTALYMKSLGWIFRTQPGYCSIYGEKLFDPDGNSFLRAQPKIDESLTFFLRLNDISLLNKIKPYVLASKPEITPNVLPDFSGRTRLFYLDNLNPLPLSGGVFSFTSKPVDIAELASNFPTEFTFNLKKTGVKTLKFTSKTPKVSTLQFAINEQSNSAQVELPENAYQLEQSPGGSTETIVVLSENIEGNTLGLVRIFPSTEGAWEPIRRFEITFQVV